MKKYFSLMFALLIISGSACQSTKPIETSVSTPSSTPQYVFPTVEQSTELANELGYTEYTDDAAIGAMTETDRYYSYGQMLSTNTGAEYELGILEIGYDPNFTLAQIEQKLTDGGFIVYNVFSKFDAMMQEFGGGGVYDNSVRITKIPGVTIYDSDTCAAESTQFATVNNFEAVYDSSLNDKFFVPDTNTLEGLLQLMNPTDYPCLNQHDWELNETTREHTKRLDRVFTIGESHVGLNLPPTAEQLATVQTVVDELNTITTFNECTVNERGTGLATCSYGDISQTDIIALLEEHGLTDYSFTNMTFTFVLVPYHEEDYWAEQLKTWPEIESVGFNWLLELQ